MHSAHCALTWLGLQQSVAFTFKQCFSTYLNKCDVLLFTTFSMLPTSCCKLSFQEHLGLTSWALVRFSMRNWPPMWGSIVETKGEPATPSGSFVIKLLQVGKTGFTTHATTVYCFWQWPESTKDKWHNNADIFLGAIVLHNLLQFTLFSVWINWK